MKIKNSQKLFSKLYSKSPGGVLAIRRPYNFVIGKYPTFFDSAKGSQVKDIDGNSYLDMMCGYGPIILGHREKYVDSKVINQIKNKGNCMTLTQPIQYELTKILNNIFKSDKSILVKTGSDATSLSIRLARSFTGKSKILRCGYHGWHDWCVGDKYGIPKYIQKDIIEFPYNDLNKLENLLIKFKDKVAAIIMWPIHTPLGQRVEFPNDDYLEDVKRLSIKHSVVLIFDEIRSGFRMGLTGSQSIYKVKPNLSIIGKAMGNGYPISAVVGDGNIMDQAIYKVFVSSTFFANSIDQIAALSNIKFIKKNKVMSKNKIKGKIIEKNIIKIIDKQKIKCNYSGGPWFPCITFEEKNENLNRKIRDIFFSELIENNIFLAPYHHGYIMHRHSSLNLKYFINILNQSFDKINKAI